VKILIADDETTSRKILEKLLIKWGYEVVSYSNGYDAWEELRSKTSPRLAVLDWMMPGMDGLEICRALREIKTSESYTYIIILTAKDKKEDIVQGMEAGADDFLSKPFDTQELKARIRSGRRILNLQTELVSEREAFKFQATHDVLTGLPNRILLSDRMTMEIARANRSKELVGVLYLDLDRFKIINDTLGHASGDILLEKVSRRLEEITRKCDTVARVGGDEFVIIVPQIKDAKHTVSVANRIIETLKYSFDIDDNELYISPSIGIVVYPYSGQDVETLLKNADTAMYQAKEGGKNTYKTYEPGMGKKAYETMKIEKDMRKALEREEFVLHYQPQFGIAENKIVGMEALIRWQHPEIGLVPPDRFIGIAEESGIISQIGDWVIKTACKQNKEWQNAGYPHICVSVNLSVRQFQFKDIFKTVSNALKSSKLDSKWLDLEITESDIMQNSAIAVDVLSKIHNIGVKISIDDFGTGYSSLSYLKRLPVDSLKIDRSFISDININQDDAEITKAIIAMAKALSLNVVAEGVETVEQLEVLTKLKCDIIQGYFFSRPLPPAEIQKYLLKINNGIPANV